MKLTTRAMLFLLISFQTALFVIASVSIYEGGWSITLLWIFFGAGLSFIVSLLALRLFTKETRQQKAKVEEFNDRLSGPAQLLRDSGIRIVTASAQLEKTLKSLAEFIGKQTAITKEAAGTAQRIHSSSEELAQTVQRVAPVLQETEKLILEGRTGLDRMAALTHGMEVAVKYVGTSLEGIREKVERTGGVITAISKVSARTDLLSFNAAIEAEKAGEFGHGFAVVGREVRQLSGQTEIAALDLKKILNGMNSALSAGKIEVEKFREQVVGNTDEIRILSAKLNQIAAGFQQLVPYLDQTTRSMQFQSTNAGQIQDAMTELTEDVTQAVKALEESLEDVKELALSAQELQEQLASHSDVES